jgi:hypothetical protein
MYMISYTYNTMSKTESPMDVQRWLRDQLADILPAGLGCLSVRRSPCIREHCPACLSGEKHPSHFLSGRVQGRPFALYVPEELVPEVRRCLENGRALQDLLHQTIVRYTQALKQERKHKRQKVKK